MISIIVPCYNQGKFLSKAIESILTQSYPNYEIIVVDDGSTDNTKEVAQGYNKVTYIHQYNQGLSAARNTGIKYSTGRYLVFLDADDWLLPNALKINLGYIESNQNAAFVYGGHEIFNEETNKSEIVQHNFTKNHYHHLLHYNYIAMIASVMFQRWVFDSFEYDTTLKACEDYDLYLKIARKFQLVGHPEVIAVYRFHGNNISLDHPLILKYALSVLIRQKDFLVNRLEKKWYEKGVLFWNSRYSLENPDNSSKREDFYNKKIITAPIALIKKIKRRLIKLVFEKRSNIPKQGKVNLGDFNSIKPFSEQFGYDRGGPVDRYYIENFLEKNSTKIKGRVLEIGDNEYTLKFGKEAVAQSDILHIDGSNPKATFVGDLSDAPLLPDNSFDCIILTQTLHLIYDYNNAIKTCYRILKKHGVLLITVPGISHIAHDEWGKFWLWSFTDNSLNRILSGFFSAGNIHIKTFGNVLTASAFLYGMGLPELTKKQLDYNDVHYQLIIAVAATK